MRIRSPSRSISSSPTPLSLKRTSSSLISSMVIRGSSKMNKLFGRRRQDFAAVGGDQHGVFNANASHAVDIGARLDGDHHSGLQHGLVLFPDSRTFMDFESQAMTGGMDEFPFQSMLF